MELTKEYLEKLIFDGIEESSQLEYKAAGALSKEGRNRDEITKDISAFANAAGGRLIYGIREFTEKERDHLPKAIDPIDRTNTSKEWLDQIISQIQPKIEGVTITPIFAGPKNTDYCYVVDIPQGTTAHQAKDKRYYKRRNFEVTAMEDYEIRDVMNRKTHPVLSVQVRVICIDNTFEQPSIEIKVCNSSRVMARHFRVVVHFPIELENTVIEIAKGGRFDEGEDGAYWTFSEGNAIGTPLFPDDEKILVTRLKRNPFSPHRNSYNKTINYIRLILFADEMEKKVSIKGLNDALAGWA